MLRVDSERCTGCGACLDACPVGAIRLADGVAVINTALCQECQACTMACPQGAIQPVGEPLPVVEGKVVTLPEHQLVVQQPIAAVTRPVSRPWLSELGMAMAVIARGVLPRLTAQLLEAWERRQSTTASGGRSAADASLSDGAPHGRHGQRQRRGR